MLSLFSCRSETVSISADVPLGADESTCRPNQHTVPVATLHPGDLVTVLGRSYGKDFMCYRVRTTSGVEGYLLAGTRGVRLQ
jgi:hypothetical protein